MSRAKAGRPGTNEAPGPASSASVRTELNHLLLAASYRDSIASSPFPLSSNHASPASSTAVYHLRLFMGQQHPSGASAHASQATAPRHHCFLLLPIIIHIHPMACMPQAKKLKRRDLEPKNGGSSSLSCRRAESVVWLEEACMPTPTTTD